MRTANMTTVDGTSGHLLQYRSGVVNPCPGCAGTQWLIGRSTAQCAHCETALPLTQRGECAHRPTFVSRTSSTACNA